MATLTGQTEEAHALESVLLLHNKEEITVLPAIGTLIATLSSLASAEQFRKVKEIILADPERCYVVPSAPGKRFDGDTKVTDMLYHCYGLIERNQGHEEYFSKIMDRYLEIVPENSFGLGKKELLPDKDLKKFLGY